LYVPYNAEPGDARVLRLLLEEKYR